MAKSKPVIIISIGQKKALWYMMKELKPISQRPFEMDDLNFKAMFEIYKNVDWFWQDWVGEHNLLNFPPPLLKRVRPKEFERMQSTFWNTIAQRWLEVRRN